MNDDICKHELCFNGCQKSTQTLVPSPTMLAPRVSGKCTNSAVEFGNNWKTFQRGSRNEKRNVQICGGREKKHKIATGGGRPPRDEEDSYCRDRRRQAPTRRERRLARLAVIGGEPPPPEARRQSLPWSEIENYDICLRKFTIFKSSRRKNTKTYETRNGPHLGSILSAYILKLFLRGAGCCSP